MAKGDVKSNPELGDTDERRIDIMELLQLARRYGKSPQYFLSSD